MSPLNANPRRTPGTGVQAGALPGSNSGSTLLSQPRYWYSTDHFSHMTPKTILITGSNKGIGYELVRQLAHLGHQVILTARNPEKGEAAKQVLKAEGLDVHFLQLDVTGIDQIGWTAKIVEKSFDQLDVLIHNAGILYREDQSILKVDPHLLNDTLQTNAVSALYLVEAFAPVIPDGGRIIHVSSGGGSMTDPVGGWSPIYCISKTLLNAITRHQAHALSGRNITVNAFCPGWVRTDMGGRSAPRLVAQGADTGVWLATAHVPTTGKFFRDRKVIPW